MDTKVFTYVVELARTKNNSRAAKALYITPQGLSGAIRRLESTLGVTLFDYHEGSLELTDYGEVVHRYAREFIETQRSMDHELSELRRAKEGHLRVAVSTGLLNIIPREVFEAFGSSSTTGAQVSFLRSLADFECENALLSKQYDFALLNTPVNHRQFASMPLHKDTLFLWAPSDSRHATSQSVTTADLEDEEIICITSKEFITTKNYAQRLEEGPRPCRVVHADEMISVMEMAMERHCCAIVPRTHALAFSREDHVALPINDITWGFSVAYHRDRALSPQDREFLDYLGSFSTFYC